MHALAHDLEPLPDLPGVELHRGDLTAVADVRSLMIDLAPDEVYNLAALSSVARSWEEPDLTARVNGMAAAALMESALLVQEKHGRPVRLVQASSAEIFGEPERHPQDESTPLRPVNPYGAAKAYAHLMVDVYRRRELHAVSAILYNHESPRRPEQFVTRKITATVAAIAHGRADHLTLGNLDARRDWGWAPDYVDAMVRAARADTATRLRRGDRRRRTRCATSWRRRSRGPGSTTGRTAGHGRPGVRPPRRPDRARRRRDPGADGGSTGSRRWPSTSWSAGWSTPTSRVSRRAARADRRRTRSSSEASHARRARHR